MINIIGNTDTGKRRKMNQDRLNYKHVSDNLAYIIVCDGMGGENGGNIASSKATQVLTRLFDKELHDDIESSSIKYIMESAVQIANAEVFDMSKKEHDLQGMGTTVVTVVIFHNTAYIAHAGDSRVYEVGEKTSQITKDHTMVQMLIDQGEITKEEAVNHPKKHYITRALGVSQILSIDSSEMPFQKGKSILICTDGLYNYLERLNLTQFVSECIRAGSVDVLINKANELGGADNITAVIAYC